MELVRGMLQGIRVSREGGTLASRYAARLLADLGAALYAPAASPAAEPSSAFEAWLDEGLRTGVPENPTILLTEDPDARGPGVTVLVDAFGEGPYAEYAYADPIAYALSGWYSITGLQGRPPLAPALPLPSLAAGANAAAAALLALYGLRHRSSNGHATVSILDTTHRMLGPWPLHYPLLGNTPVRSAFNGYRWTVVAPTADGYVVTPYARPEWELIALLLDEPELA